MPVTAPLTHSSWRPRHAAIDRLVPRRQKAQGYLRARRIERLPDRPPALVAHADDRAALRPFRVAHVAAVDPEVPAPRALRAPPRDGDLSLTHPTSPLVIH